VAGQRQSLRWCWLPGIRGEPCESRSKHILEALSDSCDQCGFSATRRCAHVAGAHVAGVHVAASSLEPSSSSSATTTIRRAELADGETLMTTPNDPGSAAIG
jgi:hypothetical protein